MKLIIRKTKTFKTIKEGKAKYDELKDLTVSAPEVLTHLREVKKKVYDGQKEQVLNAIAGLEGFMKNKGDIAPKFKSVSWDKGTKILITDKYLIDPIEVAEDPEVDSKMIYPAYTSKEAKRSTLWTITEFEAVMAKKATDWTNQDA